MNEMVEMLKLLVGIKDNPILILSLFSFGALALAAWAIYALIVALRQSKGRE